MFAKENKLKLMITGIAGMVGSHMTDYFYAQGVKPVGIYYNPTVPLHELGDRAHLFECDIRDALYVYRMIEQHRPSVIHHLAAQSYPATSWLRPGDTLDINSIGTVNVCEAVKLVRLADPEYNPTILVACSSAEYGASLTPERTPIKEDAPLLPLSPYGVSKVAQDLLAYQYYQGEKLKTIRARIFNTTGPRKVGDVASDLTRRAVEIELGRSKRLKVGNLTSRRAITDVRDLVKALILLAEHGVVGEAYNISGARVYAIDDVVEMVRQASTVPFEIEVDKGLLRPTDEPVIFGDSSRLVSCTGWKQEIPLEKTIEDMMNYWRLTLGAVK